MTSYSDPLCYWCDKELYEHVEYSDKLIGRLCPVLMDCSFYGAFQGGDPRDFTPDESSCKPEELAAWRAACAEWDAGNEVVYLSSRIAIDKETGEEVREYKPLFGLGEMKLLQQNTYKAETGHEDDDNYCEHSDGEWR